METYIHLKTIRKFIEVYLTNSDNSCSFIQKWSFLVSGVVRLCTRMLLHWQNCCGWQQKMFIVEILHKKFTKAFGSYKISQTNEKTVIPYHELINKWPLGGYYHTENIYIVTWYCHFTEFIWIMEKTHIAHFILIVEHNGNLKDMDCKQTAEKNGCR